MLDAQEVPLRRHEGASNKLIAHAGNWFPGCLIPQLWETEAQQTAGDPGSGSAWWSGTSGRWLKAAHKSL